MRSNQVDVHCVAMLGETVEGFKGIYSRHLDGRPNGASLRWIVNWEKESKRFETTGECGHFVKEQTVPELTMNVPQENPRFRHMESEHYTYRCTLYASC